MSVSLSKQMPKEVSAAPPRIARVQREGKSVFIDAESKKEFQSEAEMLTYLRARSSPDSNSRKRNRYEKWLEIYDSAEEPVKDYMDAYRDNGYFVLRDVLDDLAIDFLLCGDDRDIGRNDRSLSTGSSDRPKRRAHILKDKWYGAVRMIDANREMGGGVCAIRMKGRYDYPLPPRVASRIEEEMERGGVMGIMQTLCPKAKIRTSNVMLSCPGSQRQPIHTDSVWDGCAHIDPIPHYMTVLIPLTRHDADTGFTRVWPRSHRDYDTPINAETGFVDLIPPMLNRGDALVFDGLLSHCGTENKTKDVDRYFFYMAFSNRHDPNTDSTGY